MEEILKHWKSHSVFPASLRGGPLGLGDPDDLSLRNVEKDIMIPKLMEEHVKKDEDKCKKLIEVFNTCAVEHPYAFFIKCRPEVNKMKECMTSYYDNKEFRDKCTDEYLHRRSEYRRTGVGVIADSVKKRREKSEAFMRRLDEEDRARQQLEHEKQQQQSKS